MTTSMLIAVIAKSGRSQLCHSTRAQLIEDRTKQSSTKIIHITPTKKIIEFSLVSYLSNAPKKTVSMASPSILC